ncbi:MAG: hypothetical protein ACI8PV_001722 [Dinoroseobacter sp.]|jgi:hypothetical protein
MGQRSDKLVSTHISSASEAENNQVRFGKKQRDGGHRFSPSYDHAYLLHDGVRIEKNMVHVYIPSGEKFARLFDFAHNWETSKWKREVYNKVQLGPLEYDACVT